MAPRYIGGSVLAALVKQHPEYDITVLLRNVPDTFTSQYSNVKILRGDFDDTALIADTASKADIVIHNGNSKHEPSIKAHIDGLLRNSTPSSPRFLIRLSGTGAIADWADSSYYGEKNPRVWNDIHDIGQLTSLPDTALHRNIEKIVQKAAVDHGDRLKCAIICSGEVYGPGKGPGRAQSQLVPLFCDEIINNTKRAFYTQSGGNARSWVHIDDLVAVYIKLGEAAAAGGGNADWGHGYYFTATQEVSQLDFATAIGRILKKHGVIEYEEPVQLPLDDIWKTAQKSKWRYTGIYAFACNTRTVSERARKVLGYEPKAPSLFDCLEEDVLAAVRRGA
ncbi:hypothetical protein QC763_609630 [Podospora pseudopauciseta]|uniref:NAD-dependent epimerase/dehydratase domain-containing protein n=1 Tax=Podospora pseudopauciseta TaxID=2093780 RepID=A0ABR0H6F9_9PEZI|nr:hypothetical protein QC763_609630 [Podospora pseudopauciseta]